MLRVLLAWSLMVLPLSAESLVVAEQPGLARYRPLVQAVYARLGIEVTFVPLPSERALQEVNAGRVDADLGRTAGLQDRYAGLVYTREPLLEFGISAWVKEGQTLPAVWSTCRVGLVIGHKSAETFAAEKGWAVERVGSILALAEMLQAGRIDVAVMPDLASAEPFAGWSEVFSLPGPRIPAFHLFNRRWASLADKWDEALREIKASGEYQRLLRR